MDTFRQLGQLNPSGGVLSTLYTVPALTQAVVSSLSVCNQNTATTFRVSIAIGGATDDPKQYRYFDTPLAANDTLIATVGISLAAGDVVRVQSASGSVSFSLDGVEIT